MWDHFPISVGLLDRRTVTGPGTAPVGFEGYEGFVPGDPDLVTSSGPLVLTAKAQPDGSAPIFPTGAFLDVWYYTGTQWESNSSGYLWDDMARQAGVTVEMANLTWTWDSEVGLYVSSEVLTLPEQTTTGGWWNNNPDPVIYPFGDPIYLDPDWVWQPPTTYPSISLACGSLANGSPSAIALRAPVAVWSNAGRGRFARGSSDNPALLTLPSVVVKSIAGLHGDFLSGTDYYRTAEVTASTSSQYPVAAVDPKVRPSGYRLTGQTATERTWTRSETDAFTITLSDLVSDFTEFAPADSSTYGSTIGTYDGGDFLLFSRFPVPFYESTDDTTWRLCYGTAGFLAAEYGATSAGSVTLLLYGSTGFSQETISVSAVDPEGGERYYLSESYGTGKFPVAVVGMTGLMADGWNDNGAPFGAGWAAGDGGCFVKVPLPE